MGLTVLRSLSAEKHLTVRVSKRCYRRAGPSSRKDVECAGRSGFRSSFICGQCRRSGWSDAWLLGSTVHRAPNFAQITGVPMLVTAKLRLKRSLITRERKPMQYGVQSGLSFSWNRSALSERRQLIRFMAGHSYDRQQLRCPSCGGTP